MGKGGQEGKRKTTRKQCHGGQARGRALSSSECSWEFSELGDTCLLDLASGTSLINLAIVNWHKRSKSQIVVD